MQRPGQRAGEGAPSSPQQHLGALTKLAQALSLPWQTNPSMRASCCEQRDKGAFPQDGLAQAEPCVNSLLLFLLSLSCLVRTD